MDYLVKKEINKTAKKAGGSFAFWGIGALLICCGGPLVLLVLVSGGAAGLLGLLASSVYLVTLGILISILAIAWFSVKFMKIKNKGG